MIAYSSVLSCDDIGVREMAAKARANSGRIMLIRFAYE
jgi:hypothetical protein